MCAERITGTPVDLIARLIIEITRIQKTYETILKLNSLLLRYSIGKLVKDNPELCKNPLAEPILNENKAVEVFLSVLKEIEGKKFSEPNEILTAIQEGLRKRLYEFIDCKVNRTLEELLLKPIIDDISTFEAKSGLLKELLKAGIISIVVIPRDLLSTLNSKIRVEEDLDNLISRLEEWAEEHGDKELLSTLQELKQAITAEVQTKQQLSPVIVAYLDKIYLRMRLLYNAQPYVIIDDGEKKRRVYAWDQLKSALRDVTREKNVFLEEDQLECLVRAIYNKLADTRGGEVQVKLVELLKQCS